MALVTRPITGLINGVSQQPGATRLDSQATEQLNGLSSITDGPGPRPPAAVVAKLLDSSIGECKFFRANADDGELYFGVIKGDGTLLIYDSAGVAQTVNGSGGGAFSAAEAAYLTESAPRTDFGVTSAAGQTFILNRNETVAMGSALTAARPQRWLFWVKQGAGSTDYSVNLTGWAYSDNDAGVDSRFYDLAVDETVVMTEITSGAGVSNTSTIATNLAVALGLEMRRYDSTVIGAWFLAYPGVNERYLGNWAVRLPVASSSVVVVDLLDDPQGTGSPFGVEGLTAQFTAGDGLGNSALSAIGEAVQSLSDLPADGAPNGTLVRVSGANTDAADDFYVIFEGGTWSETVGPETEYALDPDTMPHVLVRDSGTGDWTFGAAAWGERTAGDSASAPDPSFVGQTIQGLGIHKNRLIIETTHNTVSSESGELLNFFPTTVRQVLDSDPIDLVVGSAAQDTKPPSLRHMTSVAEELVLWGDAAQAIISSSDSVFTADSATLDVSTYFESDMSIPPVVMGDRVYYVAPSGARRSLWEYTRDGGGAFSAVNTGAHLKDYLPETVAWLAPGHTVGTICLGSDDHPHALWAYRVYREGARLLQSSWSRWEFDAGVTIRGALFEFDTLYLLLEYETDGTTRTMLEKMEFNGAAEEAGTFDHPLYLDHKHADTLLTANYDAATNTTSCTAPYALDTNDGWIAVVGADSSGRGGRVFTSAELTFDGTTTVRLPGAFEDGANVWLGRSYAFEYTFSPFYLRQSRSSNSPTDPKPITTGRTQIKALLLLIKDAGPCRVEVTPVGRTAFEQRFVPRRVGTGLATVGAVVPEELAEFMVGVGSNARNVEIKFINDSVFPSTIVSAEYMALHHSNRGTRI